MRKTVHMRRINFQCLGIIWTLFTCVMYKIALHELDVLLHQIGAGIDVGFFKLVITTNSSWSTGDSIFLYLLGALLLQGIGLFLAIREARQTDGSGDKDPS